MELPKKISNINKIVYPDNEFRFGENDNLKAWNPFYIDMNKFRKSEVIYSVYFSHIYCELLFDFCMALNMPYLFSLCTIKTEFSNEILLKGNSKKVKNKNELIRKSAYLQHIVKTYEENEYDIFNPKCVHSIFDYDNVDVIKTVRSVLLEFLIKSSVDGESERFKIFKEKTKNVLKWVEKRNKIEEENNTIFYSEVIKEPKVESNLLTVIEATEYLKVSRQTISNWRKNGTIQAHGIGKRVYFKKEELDKAITQLK